MIQKIEDHKIFEIKITRSQKKMIQKTRITKIRRSKSCDHKVRRDQNHMITTKMILNQIIFISQIIRSNYFPVPDHKIKMFSYLRSQDQMIFIFQITRSIFFLVFRSRDQIIFLWQITRSHKNLNWWSRDHKQSKIVKARSRNHEKVKSCTRDLAASTDHSALQYRTYALPSKTN